MNNYSLTENEKYKIDKNRVSALFKKSRCLYNDIKANNLNPNKSKERKAIHFIKTEILFEAEKILAYRLSPSEKPTKHDAKITAIICLALSYARPSWTECDDFFKLVLVASINHHKNEMELKEIKNVLHALAHIGLPIMWQAAGFSAKESLIGLLNIVNENIDESNEQFHANVLWDIGSLHMDFNDIQPVCAKIINKILNACAQDKNISNYHDFAITQISSFLAIYKDKFPAGWQEGIQLLTDCCRQRNAAIAATAQPKSSSLHAAIMPYIHKYATRFSEQECFLEDGSPVDAYFPNESVVFQFDGKHHTDSFGNFNAHTLNRDNVVSSQGVLVVHITSDQWNRAKDKDEFITQHLIKAGIPVRTVKQTHSSSTQNITQTLQSDSTADIYFKNSASISITIQNIDAIPSLTFTVQNPNVQSPTKQPQVPLWIAVPKVEAKGVKRKLEDMLSSNSESNDSAEPASKYYREDLSSSPQF